MNLRHFYILLGSLGMYFIPLFSYASVTYTPGANISMTGSNEDIRFDVTEVLNDEGASATSPKLDGTTLNFYGTFYMTGIGWGLFQTGVYQVGLDCGSSPDFSALPSVCHLTGSGWSETIGELDFSGAEYITASGTLSGSIETWVGNVSLSGIYLPLKPAYLTIDLNNTIAKHDHTLVVSGALSYGEGGTWEFLKEPQKWPEQELFDGGFAGVFSSVDFSLADDYDITITDPNGGTTKSRIKILPGGLSFSLMGGSYFSETFCNNHATQCPDGSTLSATELVKTGNNLVGDGESYYHFRLKGRDQYGNSINSGTVKIKYLTTVKTNQIDDIDTIFPTDFNPSVPGDAAIVSSGVLMNLSDGTSESSEIPMIGQDVFYSIASIAPTDATNNIIKLESIYYTPTIGPSIPLVGLDTTPLTFRPWFTTLTTSPIPEIHIGEDHTFKVDITSNSSRTDTPSQIYTFITIGDGLFAAFRDFTSLDTIDCQAYPQDPPISGVCNWPLLRGTLLPSVLKITTNSTSFTFTGSYAPMTRYPIEESVKSRNIIHYTGLDTYGVSTDILYHNPAPSNFGNSLFQDSNVKILGTSNGGKEYGDIWLEGNGKAKFLDGLRQKITLLSRNRTNYDNTDYLVINGDFTLTGGSYATKRSIIVLGGNTTITGNIAKKDSSLALVVLSNTDGIGGNITINPDVTDLNVSLITDRHIESTGDNQLYIYGSLISSNTLGDSLARICPYYVSVPCDAIEAGKYDLENLRKNFRELSYTSGIPAINPQAIGYPHTPLIIEHDMRILSNPPPGL